MQKILRRRDVEAITGLSRSTIYSWVAEGSFPRPIPLGRRAVGWREADIASWIDGRALQRSANANERQG